MAWVDVTTHDGPSEIKTTINTDNVTHLLPSINGGCLIFFACATANMYLRLEAKETREYLLKEIRKQEAGIKPPA